MSLNAGLAGTVLRAREGWSPGSRTSVVVVGVQREPDGPVKALPANQRVVKVHGNPVVLEVRDSAVTALPACREPDQPWQVMPGHWTASGAYVVADDSRLRALLIDLLGLSYAHPIPLHSRLES